MHSHSIRYWLWRSIGFLAFNRITLIDHHNLPSHGPVLFVATHRNGALDAAPYWKAVPQAVPMVSAQLHRLPLGRFLFHGIAVARTKDKVRGIQADNSEAMQQCLTLLQQGGQLLVMPEGTSTLGPRHLPFHRGAARIAQTAINAGIALTIVPLGVHYEDPTTWQSRVEVFIGKPRQPMTTDSVELHREICAALEEVGVNFVDDTTQAAAERLAYACTLGTDQTYSPLLLSFAQHQPSELFAATHSLDRLASEKHLCLHQGVPLMPTRGLARYLLYWLLLLPLVSTFVILNLPVVIAGRLASRLLPDDRNVIAFWRMLIGLPMGVLWSSLITTALLVMSHPIWLALYWINTVAGIRVWYRFRKLSVALCNALLHRDSKTAVMQIYQTLLHWLPHERTA